MPIDWSKIKSAEVIDDPGKIADVLFNADARLRESSVSESRNPTTFIERDEDGRARVSKKIFNNLDSTTALPPVEELQKLAESVGLEWRNDYADRVIPYWASDERVDRHGDIVRQKWKFDNFSKNPVVPYSHDWGNPPIGNSIRWQILERSDDDYEGPALHLLNLFATADTWAWADTVFRLIKAGFLKTSSVGFYPLVILDIKDDKEREELGLGRWGYVYELNELIEHSPTTVPANPGAVSLLRSAAKKGLVKSHDILAIREMERLNVQRGRGDSTQWRASDARWRTVWGAVFPNVRLEEHNELDVPIALESPESFTDRIDELTRQVKDLTRGFSKLESILDDIGEVRELLEDLKLAHENEELTQSPSSGDETGGLSSSVGSILANVVEGAEKAAAALGG